MMSSYFNTKLLIWEMKIKKTKAGWPLRHAFMQCRKIQEFLKLLRSEFSMKLFDYICRYFSLVYSTPYKREELGPKCRMGYFDSIRMIIILSFPGIPWGSLVIASDRLNISVLFLVLVQFDVWCVFRIFESASLIIHM